MWRDVCLHNKDAILEMLARFSEDLASLQRAIRWGDGEKLFDLFTRTRAIRRSIIEAGQEIDAPDFGRQAVEHPGQELGRGYLGSIAPANLPSGMKLSTDRALGDAQRQRSARCRGRRGRHPLPILSASSGKICASDADSSIGSAASP